MIWFPLCRWNCRISNICFDFFNCACLKKTITNIRNSTGPNSKYVDELPRTLANDKSTVTSSYFCGCLRIYELYNSYHLFWDQIGSNWIKLDQTGSNWIKVISYRIQDRVRWNVSVSRVPLYRQNPRWSSEFFPLIQSLSFLRLEVPWLVFEHPVVWCLKRKI